MGARIAVRILISQNGVYVPPYNVSPVAPRRVCALEALERVMVEFAGVEGAFVDRTDDNFVATGPDEWMEFTFPSRGHGNLFIEHATLLGFKIVGS